MKNIEKYIDLAVHACMGNDIGVATIEHTIPVHPKGVRAVTSHAVPTCSWHEMLTYGKAMEASWEVDEDGVLIDDDPGMTEVRKSAMLQRAGWLIAPVWCNLFLITPEDTFVETEDQSVELGYAIGTRLCDICDTYLSYPVKDGKLVIDVGSLYSRLKVIITNHQRTEEYADKLKAIKLHIG